jgi:hypothetical protein
VAKFKDSQYVTPAGSDVRFTAKHKPGDTDHPSGIYRCTGCDTEIVSVTGDPLPSQNRHQHVDGTGSSLKGPVQWHLVVAPEHQSDYMPGEAKMAIAMRMVDAAGRGKQE